MKYINNNIYKQIALIEMILKTNKGTNDNIFWSEKNKFTNIILNLDRDLFYKSLVILNKESWFGYFSLEVRELLKNDILINDNKFKEIIDNKEVNDDIFYYECVALNYLLEKCYLNNNDIILENLEKVKKELNCQEKHFYRFKYRMELEKDNIYTLYQILSSIIEKRIHCSESIIIWFKENYNKELNIVSDFLESKIFLEV